MALNVKCVLCGKGFRYDTETRDARKLFGHLRSCHPELKLPSTAKDAKEEAEELERTRILKEDDRKKELKKNVNTITRCECDVTLKPNETFKKLDRVSGLYLVSSKCNQKEKKRMAECGSMHDLNFRSSILSRSFYVDNCCVTPCAGPSSSKQNKQQMLTDKGGPNFSSCPSKLSPKIPTDEPGKTQKDAPGQGKIQKEFTCKRNSSSQSKKEKINPSKAPVKQCRASDTSSNQRSKGGTSTDNLICKSCQKKDKIRKECNECKDVGSIKLSKNGESFEFQSKHFKLIEKLLELEQLKTDIANELTEIDSEINRQNAGGKPTNESKLFEQNTRLSDVRGAEEIFRGKAIDYNSQNESVESLENAKRRFMEISDSFRNINNIDELCEEIKMHHPSERKSENDKKLKSDSLGNISSKLERESVLKERIERLEMRMTLAQRHLKDITDCLRPETGTSSQDKSREQRLKIEIDDIIEEARDLNVCERNFNKRIKNKNRDLENI